MPLPDRKSTRLNSSHLGISYAVFFLLLLLPRSTLFPYTTLFRSGYDPFSVDVTDFASPGGRNVLLVRVDATSRSEEHTSELQSLRHLVCRLFLVTSST